MFAIAWRVGVGDPDFIGWATTIAYLIAAVLCGRAAASRKAESRKQEAEIGRRSSAISPQSSAISLCRSATPWWIVTGVVVFLGINKQLDFQTLLIELGRDAARAEGWYESRRLVQAIFVIIFTLFLAVALILFLTKWRWFLTEHPLAVAGIILLFVYAGLRASVFNHIAPVQRLDPDDKHWSWVIEVAGTICVAWSSWYSLAKENAERTEDG